MEVAILCDGYCRTPTIVHVLNQHVQCFDVNYVSPNKTYKVMCWKNLLYMFTMNSNSTVARFIVCFVFYPPLLLGRIKWTLIWTFQIRQNYAKKRKTNLTLILLHFLCLESVLMNFYWFIFELFDLPPKNLFKTGTTHMKENKLCFLKRSLVSSRISF